MRRKTNFENLRIWKEAHKLMLAVHKLANQYLTHDKSFQSQIKRSLSSVPDNIAECSGAYYFKDKLKCLYVSRKESAETQNHLMKMSSLHLSKPSETDPIIDRYQGLIIGINTYKRKIQETMNKK